MIEYPEYIQKVVSEFSKLPGIGYKTAIRLTMHILNREINEINEFCDSVKKCKEKLRYCEKCNNFSDDDICLICKDTSRDKSTICVVQDVKDVYAFEKIGSYKGLYYVLHGLISPIKGIGPDDLKIELFVKRVKEEKINEVILATNPTLEGEATSIYISKLFSNEQKLTRLAYGVPLGSDLEYVDEITLSRALDFRQRI
ncbi:recombination protein RecR [Candidatus Arthromitus sp. SFB-mouse-Japan]|uniref:recombination mediator RecR n=2 Tax=Candidatus Neoarthromitus TaxID=49082 RepID=UPI00021B7FF6|nr:MULTISPECIES: recombination mediator RecR [unclassified Candidatus Arthromitus]EIA22364.1 Recombination protein RecR [Candidatus Arthromitus sp. SFB-1]EIA28721.1 Recombination protein recR [Candidatus Arthromitus sp. SFB-co]EIA31478.1 Recombination protein RecR [Candidatus Arthromitus sp. SFB-mouse-SU]AID43980.1 Recombination protein RecR [Candidatus Arthromitus sp. SFB-mouse-NL]BAK55817.1 recombination protein RecR [Candidatus Arthromitus sp. SFB-mouse-Japan]